MKDNKEAIGKNKIIWMLLFVVIAVATVWTILSQMGDFSIQKLIDYCGSISPVFVILSFLGVFGFVFFEGLSIRIMGKEYGHNISYKNGFVYAASDIYFSAITPSATGGQPACAYFMAKDGLPVSFTTMSLIINLMMYTASLTFMGLITIIVCPSIFLKFKFFGKLLIVIGCIIQILLILLFASLLFKDTLVENILNKFIYFLHRIHIVRYPEARINKYKKTMQNYKKCVNQLKDKKSLLVKTFICNICQRICQMIIPSLILIGTNGGIKLAIMVWFVQTLVILGSYVIPIPGAMGVTDYLMITGFAGIISYAKATNLELIARGISFYICILFCGISTLIKYIIVKKKEK